MKQLVSSILSIAFLFSAAVRADEPKGFQDPVLLEKVMGGQIVSETMVDTKTEIRQIVRSFFKKVSPEAYQGLAVSHKRFPDLFQPEVIAANTLKVNQAKTEYDYDMEIVIKMGPLEQKVTPIIKQTLTISADAISEGKVEQTITNYKEKLVYSMQTTRLIPYKDGILVEDDIHFVLTKEAAAGGVLKKYLKELFGRYSSTFRTALGG